MAAEQHTHWLAEQIDEVDDLNDARYKDLADRLVVMNRLLTGVLVSTTTAAVLLALNLAVHTIVGG